MEWANKRKILYIIIFTSIIAILVAYPAYLIFHKEPTCFDNKQNGSESGVDCGGNCSIMCIFEIKAPRVVWAKMFTTGENKYDLGAYIENANTNAGVKKMRYIARIFDSAGNILTERNGVLELAPSSTMLLFESGVVLTGAPNRVEIEFNQEDFSRWTKATVKNFSVLTKNQSLKNTDTKPRFDAVLVNTDSVNDVSDLTIGAVIYNVNRTPVAVSSTYVDHIQSNGEQDIFFTWTDKFASYDGGFITEIVITPRAVFSE